MRLSRDGRNGSTDPVNMVADLSLVIVLAIGMCWVLASGCASVPVSDVMRKAQLATQLAQCADQAYTEYARTADDADAGVHE